MLSDLNLKVKMTHNKVTFNNTQLNKALGFCDVNPAVIIKIVIPIIFDFCTSLNC